MASCVVEALCTNQSPVIDMIDLMTGRPAQSDIELGQASLCSRSTIEASSCGEKPLWAWSPRVGVARDFAQHLNSVGSVEIERLAAGGRGND